MSPYIGRRYSNNVFALRLETAILFCSWFEQSLVLLEAVPGRFDYLRSTRLVEVIVQWFQDLPLSSWCLLYPIFQLDSRNILPLGFLLLGNTIGLLLLRLLCLLLLVGELLKL